MSDAFADILVVHSEGDAEAFMAVGGRELKAGLYCLEIKKGAPSGCF